MFFYPFSVVPLALVVDNANGTCLDVNVSSNVLVVFLSSLVDTVFDS
jgi:hypothetical protein